MSDVRFTGKLWEGVEIEWKPLGELIKLERGRQLNKELLSENGLYPAFNGGISHSGFTDSYNYDENTIIVRQGGPSAGFVKFVTSKFYANAHCYVVLPRLEIVQNRYIYHFLALKKVQLSNKKQGVCLPSIRASHIKELQVPIPCPRNPEKSLKIQSEIVRVLDLLTTHTEELTSEITARKKQYLYYRDKLLTFEDGQVEWKTLGEVAGYQQPTKYLVKSTMYNNEFNTPVLTAGKTFILGYTDETDGIYNAQENPVIIYDDFTTAHKWVDFDFKAKSSAMKMITSKDKSDVLLKYVFYWLKTLPSEPVYSSLKRQWISNYSKKKIPVPSLAEQTRIVDILDKFDALTKSNTGWLPREIKLRQQQYGYYLKLLFSFPNRKCKGEPA